MATFTEPQSQSQNPIPFSHAAAGHAGISTSADGALLIKPCTPAEIAFYEAAKHHPNFQAHMPVYMGNLTLNDSPEEQAAAIALMSAQTQRDSTGAEDTNGATIASATAAASTKDDTTNINTDIKPDIDTTTTGPIVADPIIDPDPTKKWTPSGGAKLTSNLSIVLSNATAGFVRPNIIDLKLGARLWDDDAPTAKRAKLDEVSQNSTSSSLGFRVAGMKVWVGDKVEVEVEEESEEEIEKEVLNAKEGESKENKVGEVSEDRKTEVESEEKITGEDESGKKEIEEDEAPAPAPAPATVVVIQVLTLGHILKGSPFHETEHSNLVPVSAPVTASTTQEINLGHILRGSPFQELELEHSVSTPVPAPTSAPAQASTTQELTLGHIMKGSPFEEHPSTPVAIDEVTTETNEEITKDVTDEATEEVNTPVEVKDETNDKFTETKKVDDIPVEPTKEVDTPVNATKEVTDPPAELSSKPTNPKPRREPNTTITNGYKTYDKFYGRSNMHADGSNISSAFTSFLHSLTLLPTPKPTLTSPISPTSSYHSAFHIPDLTTARIAARRKLLLTRILREIESIQYVLENEESRMYSASILIVYEGDPDALDSVLVYSSPGIISYDDVDVVTAYVRPGVDPVFTDGDEDEDEDDEDEDGDMEEEDEDAPDIDEEEDDDDDDETRQKIHEVVMIDFAHAKFVPGEGPDENALKGVRSIRRILRDLLKSPS